MKFLKKTTIILLFLIALVFGQWTAPQLEWSEHYESNQITYVNESSAGMVKDSEGYLYVAGTGKEIGFNDDILVMKLDTMGNTIWKKYIDFGYNESSKTIMIDKNENIYVCGVLHKWSNAIQIIFIKLDSDGHEIWSSTYLVRTWAEKCYTKLDNEQNIIFTGTILPQGGEEQLLLLKYSNSGELLWKQEYDSTSNEDRSNVPRGMAVDDSNNTYILLNKSQDLCFLKYAPNGEFVGKYTISDDPYIEDTSLLKDDYGHLNIAYLTGWTLSIAQFSFQGNKIWETEYTGVNIYRPLKMKTNSTGKIFVSYVGYADSSDTEKLITFMYDNDGNLLWHNNYYIEKIWTIHDLVFDTADNISMAGEVRPHNNLYLYGEYLFFKCDSSGKILFEKHYHDQVDLNRDVKNEFVRIIKNNSTFYMVGTSSDVNTGDDITFFKYSDSGLLKIFKRIECEPISYDQPVDLVLSPQGEPVTLSTSYKIKHGPKGKDFFLNKYDKQGNHLWSDIYNKSVSDNNAPADLVFDKNSNIYVIGTTEKSGSGQDVITFKYNSNGTRIWTKVFDNDEHASDQACKIVTDNNGNLIIGGTSTRSATQNDYLIIKYSQDGDEIWKKYYNGSANSDDQLRDLCVDSLNNIYVTGKSKVASYWDIITVKYDENGNIIWTNSFDSPSHKNDIPNSIKISPHGELYIAGMEDYGNFLLIKFDTNGLVDWYKIQSDKYGHGNGIEDMAFDKNNNLYITGALPQESGDNCITIKYSANGYMVWKKEDKDSWKGIKIDIDNDNNIYVLDKSGKIIKYLSNGQNDWIFDLGSQFSHGYLASDMICAANNRLYILGLHYGPVYSLTHTILTKIRQYKIAFPPNFKTTILQNPAASKYCDVVVTADTSLRTGPQVTIFSPTDTTELQMLGINGLKNIYKDSYTFNTSGTYYLKTKVTGINGLDSSQTREFNVMFTKNGKSATLKLPANKGCLYLSEDAVGKDMYVTAYYDSGKIVDTYHFGPQVHLEKECKLTLRYNPDKYLKIKNPVIFSKEGEHWIPLKTNIDVENGLLSTNIKKLGVFKIAEHTNQNTAVLPDKIWLYQNYPNPFNSSTIIKYDLPQESFVRIEIYDVLGQRIKTLVNKTLKAGTHVTHWDGTDYKNKAVSSGIYIYSMKTNSIVLSKRLLILK